MPASLKELMTMAELTVEELAKELHEAGRAAVEAGLVVNKVPGPFLEWDEITEQAREGRRVQARYLLSKLHIAMASTATVPADEIKRVPAGDFLMGSGLLFEINRRVLHPLGLALEVQIHEDGAQLGDLWDYRDDPEGMLYGAESFSRGLEKYNRFMEEVGTAKLDERLQALGFTVQERPDQ